MGEKDDDDSENSWISDGLPSSIIRQPPRGEKDEGVEYISGMHMVAKHDLKTCLCVMLTNIEGGQHGGGGGRLRKFE